MLDAQNEKLVSSLSEAIKGLSATNTAEAIASAKKENRKGKNRKKKVADTDDALEDEADPGDDDPGSTAATKAADETDEVSTATAELTPEEIEANEVAAKARKEFKAAKKAKKEAAENAAVAKAIEEAVTKATSAVESLKEQLANAEKATEDRLATVEKMAAPSNISRTASPAAQTVAKERDVLDLELAKYERLSKSHEDMDYRRECGERAKALRVKIAGMSSST